MMEPSQLLAAYARKGDETAFRELVARYVDLVFSVARRRVDGDVQLAEDVTQTVFADLARRAREAKGESLPTQLGGWLHRHTCFVAANLTRAARRRRQRETQAALMNDHAPSPASTWRDLAPELDEAVNQLAPPDRQAIVLRFYERRDLRTVGAALGVSDDAAQKRIRRALEKLRALLGRRGVTLSLAGLGGLLREHAVTAAPTGLARRVAQSALAGVPGSGGLLALLRGGGALKGALLLGTATVGLGVAAWIWPAGQTGAPETAAAVTRPRAEVEGAKERSGSGMRTSLRAAPAPAARSDSTWLADRTLQLTLVTADTGHPVPNAKIYRWIRVGAQVAEREPAWTDRFGRCVIPLPVGVTLVQLATRSAGFADTQLLWRPDRGETVPAEYTLRLDRAVPIGGRVLDASGQPVTGAEVRFHGSDDPDASAPPEKHIVGPEAAVTDASGRWRIDWIADDLIGRLCGRARHSRRGSSPEVCVQFNPEAERLLRGQEFVFHLRPGCTMRGIVVDENDRPLAGATVLVGGANFINARTGKTASDGTFEIADCTPVPDLVTAKADGYAPTTIVAKISSDTPPLRLVLKPGHPLCLRVVNPAGMPIEGARVRLNTLPFPPDVAYTNPPPPQVRFSVRTDAEGRAIWEDAPDQELLFEVSAPGYRHRYDLKFRPDGREHEIELAPALVVEGTVRDAETGQLIPRFRMVRGWPEKCFVGQPPQPTTRPRWSDCFNFAGGKFHHLLEDPPVAGVRNPGYYFKFEAAGYASQVTRLIGADEGLVRLDVRLKPASETIVSVRLPDGRPAAAIQVGLVQPGARLTLGPGGFAPRGGVMGDPLRHTDATGRFRLPTEPGIQKVIAACPAGYAEATPQQLAADPVLQLAPWGRVIGTYTRRGKPVAGIRLRLARKQTVEGFSLDFDAFQLETDARGHFDFERVPPGIHWLRRILSPDSRGAIAQFSLRQVTVRAGETTEVHLGTGGYSLTVRPGGSQSNWQIGGIIASPMPRAPQAVRANPQAWALWFHSSPVQAAYRERYSWLLEADGNGVWFAEGIPPGRYQLTLWAVNPARKSERFQAERTFTVPDDPPTGQLDLGEIPLEPVPPADR